MSIAEKLTTIAENQQGVYDAGYAKGQAEGEVDTARAASIYRIRDINALQKSDVTMHFDFLTDFYSFYQDNLTENVTVEHLTIVAKQPSTRINIFMHQSTPDNKLKHLTLEMDWSKATVSNCFYNLRELEVIDGNPIDLSSSTMVGRFFYMLTSLRHCLFAPSCIKFNADFSDAQYLDEESKQSIVDGLVDLNGETTNTLTMHRYLALTDEQKATIIGKNWTLVQ